jgi:hypothetical protein
MVMSQENVQIVRRIYNEGLIDRDPKRLLDHFATPDRIRQSSRGRRPRYSSWPR